MIEKALDDILRGEAFKLVCKSGIFDYANGELDDHQLGRFLVMCAITLYNNGGEWPKPTEGR